MSAPKSAAKRQKLERKRRRKRKVKRKRRRKQGGGLDFEPDFLRPPAGGVRMSEVLEYFVEPFFDEDIHDIEAYRRLLTLGVLAWNAALRPEPEGQAMVDDVIGKGMRRETPEVRAFARKVVDHLIERKKRYFAQCRRPILNFEVSELDDGGWHLTVASLIT